MHNKQHSIHFMPFRAMYHFQLLVVTKKHDGIQNLCFFSIWN